MLCGWTKRRIWRYQHINSHFSDDVLDWTYDEGPLLPSLLATCAPSTELALTVYLTEGKSAIAGDLKLADDRSACGAKLTPLTIIMHCVPTLIPSLLEMRALQADQHHVLHSMSSAVSPYMPL